MRRDSSPRERPIRRSDRLAKMTCPSVASQQESSDPDRRITECETKTSIPKRKRVTTSKKIKKDDRHRNVTKATETGKQSHVIHPLSNDIVRMNEEEKIVLLDLGHLVKGRLVRRPSSTIRSPYVADVQLEEDDSIVLAHAPALDVGGLCSPGARVYMSKQANSGSTKTSHSIELVQVSQDNTNEVVLVGAHPRLAEILAERVLQLGLLVDIIGFGPAVTKPREKISSSKQSSMDTPQVDPQIDPSPIITMKKQCEYNDCRVDFVLERHNQHHSPFRSAIIEVKNVVCADYCSSLAPEKKGPNHCVITANVNPEEYQRSGLFPWGRVGQTVDGVKVVSARAIKHVRNLIRISKTNIKGKEEILPVVLFVINRSDCLRMRSCPEACAVFAEALQEAGQNGVVVTSFRVHWNSDGKAFFDGIVSVHV